MRSGPRPLVLLAGAASLYLFLQTAGVLAGFGVLPREKLWTFVLVDSVLALGILELGRGLAPWRRSWLAGTLLLVSMSLVVFLRTNVDAMVQLLDRGSGVRPPYAPAPTVGWIAAGTWFLACAVLSSWLWALRHRATSVFWGLLAGVVVLNRLDFVPGRAFSISLLAVEAVAFLLLAVVLFRREMRQAERPAARAWALLACAIGAALLVGYRAELPFPVVPISLAVASGAWIAYAAAGRNPGIARGAGRFVIGVILFLLLDEGAHRGSERFARPWFMRMLTHYPDAMTVLLFFAAAFAVTLLAGGIWRVAGGAPESPGA